MAKTSGKKVNGKSRSKDTKQKAYTIYTPVVNTISTELAKGTISVGRYNKAITKVVKSSS